jgi:hypothetical protein
VSVWTFRLVDPLVLYDGSGRLHRPECPALANGTGVAKDYHWFDDGTEVSTDDPYEVLDLCCRRCNAEAAIERLDCVPWESIAGTHWVRP